MSETPQPVPEGAKETYIHDANAAHELAIKTDKLETERAQVVGAVSLLGEALVTGESPSELADRTIEEEAKKHSSKEMVGVGGTVLENGELGYFAYEERDVPTSPLGRSAMKIDDLATRSHKNVYDSNHRRIDEAAEFNAKLHTDPETAYTAGIEVAREKIGQIDSDIKSVHETGLTKEQLEQKANVEADLADLRSRNVEPPHLRIKH